jgi:glycosyltransferase involved in cell wall biosynthesis
MNTVRAKRPKVVYWNNLPAPYMVDRFNALARRGQISFEVWFNDRTAQDRSWHVDENSWQFSYKYVPTLMMLGLGLHNALWMILTRRPKVLVSLYSKPSFMMGWMLARMFGIKTVFRVLATNDRWVKRHWLKERIKRYLFKRVDAIETPGEDGAKFAMSYGADSTKIYFATHTVDMEHLARECTCYRDIKPALRREYGLVGTVYLYVGRLWSGKGIKFLIEAFAKVQKNSKCDVSLLLIGDGEDEGVLRKYVDENGIGNVVFGGYKQKGELPRYYALADVFVFPTLGDPYGVVVDEAMACSLPIISTDAAGEVRARVKDGENGFVVKAEDSDSLASSMLRLSDDEGLRKRMGAISQGIVAKNTPEQWAKDFEVMIYSMLNEKPVSGPLLD